VGLFASLSAGSGVVLSKFKGLDGRTRWSPPSAFAFGGGGGGFDFGGARSDVLLILNSDESVSMFTGTNLKVSMAVQAALGPLGRHAEGGVHLDAEKSELETNYSYGSSAGLFVGVGLQGIVVVPRDKENSEYYRNSSGHAASAAELLSGAAGLDVLGRHEEVVRLHRMLDKACGGNGRAERYDTAEMRGTPF
jgi:lipid-binding SYLF domain-containing protein